MNAKERMLKYLNAKGVTQYNFSKETGLSNGFLKSGSSISSDNLELISKIYIDLNLIWVITGNGEMVIGETKKNPIDIQDLGNISEPKMSIYKLKTDYYGIEKQQIPLYEIEASAGLNTLFSNNIQQVPLDYISVPNAPACDGAVYVRGDSMYPILKAGDIACYKTIYSIENIYYGEMHLIDADIEGDQYLTFKYVQRSTKGDNYVCLVSHNTHHAPREILKSDIRAIALVKLSIRYNTIS